MTVRPMGWVNPSLRRPRMWTTSTRTSSYSLENSMEQSNGYHTGHLVIGIASGVLVGAAIALLVAPKSGRDTRHQIDGYFSSAKEKAARVPEAFRSAGSAALETLTHEGTNSHS
ncbi:MAG: hypothetical protein CO108_21335 [Deltaproteobacteria bacterium CG_4_9_14_3_um_filter_63_12]|nr:MAG: hypothetical protein CO108_21335 [Deltaproteobacteria bacterium CG_4_9_14_3_um_filter_63_12]